MAFLVKRFPRLSETFVLNEFLELRRQGVPARLFALMDPGEPYMQPDAARLQPEVSYLREASWRALAPDIACAAVRHPRGTLRAFRFAWRRRSTATWRHLGEALVLVRYLDRETLRHVHAHFAHSPSAVAYLAHLVSRVPYSFTAHAKDLYTTPADYVRMRSEAASFVATCTEANRHYLVDVVGVEPSKVLVCRHGLDVQRFRSVPRRPVPGRILSVGRLVPKKGFDVLVQACAELARRGVAFECRICGDGPQHGELEGLIDALGVADCVRLIGARPQPELLPEYGQSEIFALAPVVLENGDRDGLPNVILEAMATGVPVVSTAMSAIPEAIVDGITGVLVPPGDASALADALAGLLTDDAERHRLGRAGSRHVSEHFDLAACVAPLSAVVAAQLESSERSTA